MAARKLTAASPENPFDPSVQRLLAMGEKANRDHAANRKVKHLHKAQHELWKRRIGTTPQTAKALLFARGPARIRNATDRPKPCPMRPKAIGHFATALIAPKPVKPCDRAILGALNSLSKREQNAPGAGCLQLAFSPPGRGSERISETSPKPASQPGCAAVHALESIAISLSLR